MAIKKNQPTFELFRERLNEIATEDEIHPTELYILSHINREALEIFQEIWPTIAPDRRAEIFQELVEMSETNFEVDFEAIFLLGLVDEAPQVRAYAINGLWENEDPALITPLLHLLQTDETPVVRAAAATALGRFIYLSEVEEIDPHYTAPATKALRETIHQPAEDTEVRRRAIESIAFWGEPEVNRIIENAYYDEDEKMQISAIFAMGRSADNRWGSYLLPELNNPNPAIRYEAARACGELEIGQALEKLIELIEHDPDVEVQESAIWALGRLGGHTAQETLENCLESDNESLVLAAEEALDELLLFNGSFDLFDFTGNNDLEAFLDTNADDELM